MLVPYTKQYIGVDYLLTYDMSFNDFMCGIFSKCVKPNYTWNIIFSVHTKITVLQKFNESVIKTVDLYI